ncbi:hypothetical protein [Amycolatopsis nalaikhensis]|uniref:Uncharacterized protein n=1 Tax=Amycolatopsis nalaikhensis TaxID=715472 RepID=A0ABY8XBK3_9PSEU|nr:hypothetical protein [Amycolatopsis sp. 2-2]WIV53275.1 hypothetical protein QP939_30720 [Amycolatopsis sp. 2-2]
MNRILTARAQSRRTLFRGKMIHESHHVMQGFTSDNVNLFYKNVLVG